MTGGSGGLDGEEDGEAGGSEGVRACLGSCSQISEDWTLTSDPSVSSRSDPDHTADASENGGIIHLFQPVNISCSGLISWFQLKSHLRGKF